MGGHHVDFWGAITVLARRYYLAVPLAALTIGLGYLFAHGVAPEYHATASLVLIGPTAPVNKDAPPPVNPYVDSLGTGTTASLLQIDTGDPQAVQQVTAAGNSTNYSVTADSRSPFLTITTTASTPRVALSTATQLVSIIQTDLAAIQAPYTTNRANQITALPAGGGGLATADTSSRTKALAVAIGVAIVLTALVTLLIDSILVRRARRRDDAAWRTTTRTETEPQHRTPVVRS